MRVLVVLGAKLREDGAPGPALLRRAETAARHFRPGDLVLASGGVPRGGVSEAAAIRRVLIAQGVPAAAVLVEADSASTAENARFCAPILAGLPAAQAMIVTDARHMARARLAFRRAGVRAGAIPAPHARAPLRDARELASLLWYAAGRPFGR